MKHTESKWEIQGGTNAKGDLFIWPAGFYYGGHAIATIHGDIQEGAEGNARLIAAAPDLLAACETLLKAYRLSRPQVFGTDAVEEEARAAIAAAKPE